MLIQSQYTIGSNVTITSGRFEGFSGVVVDHFNSTSKDTNKIESGVTIETEQGEQYDAFDYKVKPTTKIIDGWEIIDQFIEEIKEEDIKYFAKLKQLKKDIGYNAWINKIVDGEITKTDSEIIRNTDEQIKKLVDRDAENRKIKIRKQVADKVGNIIELEISRNDNGGFDGTIKGESGTVNIQTIVAGGAVQRLHYRTLIK